MDIGTLTASLGFDTSAAMKSMTSFEQMMLTITAKIDTTLEMMASHMLKVGANAKIMGNEAVAATAKVAAASKAASQQTANTIAKGGGLAISQSAIRNSAAGVSAVDRLSQEYNVSPIVARDAINQTVKQAAEDAKRVALMNANRIKEANAYADAAYKKLQIEKKFQMAAIAEDNRRTTIINSNRIKEANAEADAIFKRIQVQRKLQEAAIAEDNKRTRIAQTNAARIEALQAALPAKHQAGLMQMAQGLRSFGWLATTVFTAPIIMFGKSVITAGMNFEFTFRKMIGLAGVAKDSIGRISEEVKKISLNTGIDPQKVAESYYFVASSGIKKAADVLNITEMAAKGAASGMGEVNDIAKLLTSTMNAYAAKGLTAATTMDTLTATIRLGKAEPAEMVTAFGTILPIAEKLGMTVQDVGGALSTMTLITNSTATSATYLRNVLMKLLDPAPQVRDAMRSMGISMEQVHSLLKTPDGFIKTMELLGTTTEKYGVTMDSIFPEMRSLLGALNFTGEGLKRLKENTKEVDKSTGDFQKHLAEMSTTMQMRWNKAIADSKNSLISIGTAIANAVLPILERLVERLKNLVNWFNSLSSSNQRLVLQIAVFAAAIGPLCLLLATLGNAIGNVWGWVIKLGGGSGFGMLSGSMKALPWIAAGVGLMKLIGWFKDEQSKVEKAAAAHWKLNESMVAVAGTMKEISTLTKTDYSQMEVSTLYEAANKAKDKAREAYDKIQQLEKERVKYPSNKFNDFMGVLGLSRGAKVEKLKDPLVAEFENARIVYQGIIQYIKDYTKTLLDANEATKKVSKGTKEVHDYFKILEKLDKDYKYENKELGRNRVSFEAQPDYKKLFLARNVPGAGVMSNFEKELGLIAIKNKALGETYNTLRDKVNYFKSVLNNMFDNGMRPGMPLMDEMIKKMKELVLIQQATDALQDSFSNFFMNIMTGTKGVAGAFKEMTASIIQSFEKMLADMLAQKVASFLMNLLFPGAGTAVTALSGFAGGGMGLAKGGIVPQGYPNDTYPAMLTSGERVTPAGQFGSQLMQVEMSPMVIKDNTMVAFMKKANKKNNLY